VENLPYPFDEWEWPMKDFIPGKKYQLIQADPAWEYDDKAKAGNRGAECHYRCTKTDELARIIVPAEDDAVLFMWVTHPMLPEGLKLMDAWGFRYKTNGFTWVKTNMDGTLYMGMGHHTRSNSELCLLGIRGKGLKRVCASVRNTQLHPRGKHSEKPKQFSRDMVRLYGEHVTRLEMFAREPNDGWDVWGDEV